MSVICGVSGCISDFVVFHISKVAVGFMSHSEPMCHLFGNDAPHIKLWGASFPNCLVLDSLRMATTTCYLVTLALVYLSSMVSAACDRRTMVLGVWSENNGVMLPKSWTEDTWARNKITCDGRHSWVGLGPIHPNRIYPCSLSFLTLCFRLFSIKNGRWTTGNVWRIQWHW
jgi:hypothetical protein